MSNFGIRFMAFWVQEILLYPIPHCISKCIWNLQISCSVDMWWHLKCHLPFILISCRTKCNFFCSVGCYVNCNVTPGCYVNCNVTSNQKNSKDSFLKYNNGAHLDHCWYLFYYSGSSLIRTPVIRTLANPNCNVDCSIRVFYCQVNVHLGTFVKMIVVLECI